MPDSDTPRRRGGRSRANSATPPGAIQADTLEPTATTPESAPKGARSSAWQSTPKREPSLNSIGVASPRDRPAPETARTSEGTPTTGEPRPRLRDSEAAPSIPEHIRERYIQVGRRFHFPDSDPAFHVRANRTTTRSENSQVIRDILEIERERAGSQPLRVRGTVEFRAEAWMQAQLMGIQVRGYRPSELERAKLARTLGQEQRRARDILDGRETDAPNQPEADKSGHSGGTSAPGRERGTATEGRVYHGRLLEHGAAPYQHDRQSDMSYYIKIDTLTGERVLWGKDFERAIKQSLSTVRVGNEVSVQQVGERPVTVMARRKDEEGNFVRKEEVTAYRNRWIVETRDFIRQREEIARVVRDPTIEVREATRRHPSLVGTYLELQAAKLVADSKFPLEEDRKKFVARFRNAIADEIARGEAFSAPQVRNPDAREKSTESTRKREPRQPQTRVQEYLPG